MLLVDRVTALQTGVECLAYKNLTFNEWFFPEHFPANPIFPGSLQIEAFTQVAALAVANHSDNYMTAGNPSDLVLVSVNNAKYYRAVRPGDRFDICAKVQTFDRGMSSIKVFGSVDGRKVSQAVITYRI